MLAPKSGFWGPLLRALEQRKIGLYIKDKCFYCTLNIAHKTRHTAHFTASCSLHSTLCTPHSVYFTLLSANWTLHTQKKNLCTVCSVQCKVYIIQCTVYSVQCTVYSVKCTLYSIQCTMYSVQCHPQVTGHDSAPLQPTLWAVLCRVEWNAVQWITCIVVFYEVQKCAVQNTVQ